MIPNLKFPETPFIYRYIQFDYNSCDKISDLIELWHKWQRVIAYTNNPVKKEAFTKAAKALYSEITKKSFDTQQFKNIDMFRKEYVAKVKENREALKKLGVRNSKYYFTLANTEYKYGERDTPEYNLIDNLWYGKSVCHTFLEKMNSFVETKKKEFGK